MAITKATASSIAPAAKGDLVVGSATNDASVLSVGTNDTVLTADSSTATGLKWATPASGGMTLINTGGTTLSGASVTISSIPGTYKNLQLIIRNYKPATNDKRLAFRLNSDSGSNRYATFATVSGGGSFNATLAFIAQHGNSTNAQGLFATDFYDYTNTTTYKTGYSRDTSINSATSAPAVGMYIGVYNQLDAITSITLLVEDSANFTSGTAFLYGVS